MEVYQCLHDLITRIEKQESIIIKTRLYHGALVIIDLHKLKYNPRLDGAEIFKMLFGISDTNPYGKFPMDTDVDGNITILRELHISQGDWILFNIFLNTGAVPHYEACLLDNLFFNCVVANLNQLQTVCIKLGGLPTFDLFYENFFESKNIEKVKTTEPVTPEEDVEGKYQWIAFPIENSAQVSANITRQHLQKGWSLASVSKTSLTFNTALHYYYRNWPE